jgi:hypothetical protein
MTLDRDVQSWESRLAYSWRRRVWMCIWLLDTKGILLIDAKGDFEVDE